VIPAPSLVVRTTFRRVAEQTEGECEQHDRGSTVVQVLMRCAEVLFTLLSLTDLPR